MLRDHETGEPIPTSGRRPARRRLRRLTPLLAALVLLLQSPMATVADHGGRPIGSLLACDRPVSPPRCTSVGNNRWHFVHLDGSVTRGLASSLRDTMREDYARTELSVIEQARITPSTDVIVFSRDYGDNGAAGWVYCPPEAPQGVNDHGDRWCQRQELHLNLNPRFAAFFSDEESRDHVACHELGHTLGLRHWGNPPMSAGPPAETCMHANTPNGPTTLHQIDIDHLNAYYAVREAAPRLDPRRTIVERPADPSTDGLATWSGSLVSATELEHYTSLDEIVGGADAVVRGRVMAVDPGPVHGIPGRSVLHYAAATIRVDGLLAGAVSGAGAAPPTRASARLMLEIPLFDGPGSYAELRSSLPGEEGIFVLRRKADAPAYRLVALDGVVLNADGRAAVPAGESGFLHALAGEPFEDVVRRVSAAARGRP